MSESTEVKAVHVIKATGDFKCNGVHKLAGEVVTQAELAKCKDKKTKKLLLSADLLEKVLVEV